MAKLHRYEIGLIWQGNRGQGTREYQGYGRNYLLSADGQPDILGSSDPAFLGDATRWDPEQMFVASIATCHCLWYLHLCCDAGISVLSYQDKPTGTMTQEPNGAGAFTNITLHPNVTIGARDDTHQALELHHAVGEMCFIARSVNTPIEHEAQISVAQD